MVTHFREKGVRKSFTVCYIGGASGGIGQRYITVKYYFLNLNIR